MSLKVLHHHGKHQCTRPNCLGHPKDYNNYLEGMALKKPKKKIIKTSRSFNSLHEKVKENKLKDHNKPKKSKSKHEQIQKSQIQLIKQKNTELSDLLEQKNKKISDLKHKIKDYQSKFKQYQIKIIHLQNIVNEQDNPTSPITLDKPSEAMINHYQQQLKMLENNQKAILQSLEKYRILQKQYNEYRYESQNKLKRLQQQNTSLRQYSPNDKSRYEEQMNSLRQQIYKLSQFQQQSPISHKGQQIQNHYMMLKISNKQLMIQKENLIYKIKDKQQKQKQLRYNLQIINKKVERWSNDYQQMVDQRRSLEEKYEQLLLKYESKKDKHNRQKQEWANIFRDLMRQVQKLKKQINRYEKTTNKLVSIYTQ